MTRHTLTFERTTLETITVQVELADTVTGKMIQGWAEWGISGGSPLDLPDEQLPTAQRAQQRSKWKLTAADPALATEAEPKKRRGKK